MHWGSDFAGYEGWYLWRRNNKGGDPLFWYALFYEEATDKFWTDNRTVKKPNGGQWCGPIEPKDSAL